MSITYNQNEYLKQLSTGSKTTADLMSSMGVTAPSVIGVMARLKKMKMITTPKIANKRHYALTSSYDDLIKKAKAESPKPIDEEVLYVAMLRNGNLTGQELVAQFNKVFPERNMVRVDYQIAKARRQKLCH